MKSKKKIVALVMILALACASMIGGTLAYFTDDEAAVNTFTMGNVKIDLIEEFDEETAELIPGKDITKAVTVKNVGHNDAYVRVHIAIPANVDDGNPEFAAVAVLSPDVSAVSYVITYTLYKTSSISSV